jgi:HK97 family phage major capsid protein
MADVDSVAEQIDKGFKGLEARQEEDKKAIDAEFALLKTRMGGMEGIGSELKQTKEWLTDVEAKVNTARTHGPGSRDGLVDAIPAEYRKHVEIAERSGYKDPVNQASRGLWWHFQFKATEALRGQTGKSPQEWIKMAEDIERAWGYDPAQKYAIQKAALGDAAAGGGSIIATPVEAEILRLISDNTIIRPLATKIVMTSVSHQIPVENSNVIAYIMVTDGTTITDSIPATNFASKPLAAKGFVGLATVSNQLIQDNIVGLNDYILTAVSERIGILEDIHALEGGFPTTQNFSGVHAAAGVNTFALGPTTGTGGGYPTYAELIQLVYTGQQTATRRGAGFFMLPQVFKGVVGSVDTTGQPIFSFANVPGAIPSFIGGYPVYLVSSLSTQWTQGSQGSSSSCIYYGPPSKIIFGDLTGMSFDLDPYGLFDKVQTRMRVYKRTAIQVPVGGYFTFAVNGKMF